MAKTKQSYRAPKLTEPTHVIISTDAGRTILGLDTKVWVEVGDNAMMKFARDVTPGEKVLERAPHIDISLSQIKQTLYEKNTPYKLAHEKLHTVDEHGNTITKLQLYLRETLAKEGFSDLTNRKTLAAGITYLETHLGSMQDVIERHDSTRPKVKRSEDAITQWLTGETLLPSEPRVMRTLRLLNPKRFDALFGNRKEFSATQIDLQHAPVLWAHAHLSKRHSVLRRWLAGFAGKSESEVGEKEKVRVSVKPIETLAPERSLIYDELIKPRHTPVDEEHAFNIVNAINVLQTKPTHETTTQTTGPTMPRGVVNAEKVKIDQKGVNVISAKDAVRHTSILSNVVEGLLATYAQRTQRDALLAGPLLTLLLHRNELKTKGWDQSAKFNVGPNRYIQVNGIPQELTKLYSSITSGELDQAAQLEKGSSQKLIETFLSLAKQHNNLMTAQDYIMDVTNTPRRLQPEALSKLNKALKTCRAYGVPVFGDYQVPGNENITTRSAFNRRKLTALGAVVNPKDEFGDHVSASEVKGIFQETGHTYSQASKLHELYIIGVNNRLKRAIISTTTV